MHKVRIFGGRAEFCCAHHGWQASFAKLFQDIGDLGWGEWPIEDKKRKLCRLSFEDPCPVSQERQWIGRIWGDVEKSSRRGVLNGRFKA